MRLRTVFLSLSAFFALLYPLLMWKKERIASLIPPMKGIASWFWFAEPLLLALFLFTASALIRRTAIQYVCIIAASVLLSFAAAEIYFTLPGVNAEKKKFDSHSSIYVKSGQASDLFETGYAARDPVLGYGPNEKMRIAARLMHGNEAIYDVLYSRDEAGRRITPDRGDKADTAILLFGCSFTVGEGLNDRETFAWQLGEMLGEKFQVFNYGFHGYGSHQMLALVESGRLDALARRYKQIYAFYLTMPDHELRCLGPRPWPQGPRYVLENGAIKYAGKFSYTLDNLFAHSRVYAQVKPTYHRWLHSDRASATHAAIIAKSMHELEARYRAHALTVIYPDFTRIEPILRDKGVRTLLLTSAMPDYMSAPEKYAIKYDGHPNALANARMAGALLEYILKNRHITGERQ